MQSQRNLGSCLRRRWDSARGDLNVLLADKELRAVNMKRQAQESLAYFLIKLLQWGLVSALILETRLERGLNDSEIERT